MKPLIGITCNYDYQNKSLSLYEGYYEAICKAGGMPFPIPFVSTGEENLNIIFNHINGLLLSGGQDVDPMFFGEEPHQKTRNINPLRDQFEINLCKKAMEERIPVFGICRGMQIMNIAMGGTIYQDLYSQWNYEELYMHEQKAPGWYGVHSVDIADSSIIRNIMGSTTVKTNSFHHQAVKEVAPVFRQTARCADGVIEAIESTGEGLAFGVQWHPERMWHRDCRMLKLFEFFVNLSLKKK